MIIDQAKIILQAGNGGNGCVAFRREKYVPKGGPNGGDGGKGGSIIICANVHMHTLMDFKYKSHYRARNGDHGKGGMKNGKDGIDLILKVPCGTQVFDAANDKLLADLVKDGDEINIAKGGKGGRGNTWFATPSARTPRHAEPGVPGEALEIRLELKMIAEVGLVGLPNAGKSTLISRITRATPKIADYPFTTLEPNLGVAYYKDISSFSIADIPGLIEGASDGKGLGIKFLKHIERTKVLVILLDAFSEDITSDYKTLIGELKAFNPKLAKKTKLIVLTKMDAIDDKFRKDLKKIRFQKKAPLMISAHSGEGIDTLLEQIHIILHPEPSL
jgi:GTP-binding protein